MTHPSKQRGKTQALRRLAAVGMRAATIAWLATSGMESHAADDFKVIKLEQDVINLQRRVEELSREVDQLQQRAANPSTSPAAAATSPPSDDTARWLRAANWNRVRPGMSELEVIEILGPPASVRGSAADSSRTLMYAMELGSAAFLAGSVTLEAHEVAEIEPPTLR
jgi:hypothetical protein